ncbi:polymer-forming cytoskeletal protein [Desmospora profundinema]|uniref:Cytoskeletal protein CcmA (Bactofilin family) n=1 Tax=Desmospora profundinema TaxID=1571184 RepID=A0ABU1IK46_9BACL|nr:polymer-forming cytoskeletal protein [Desmospora profundinema]MDR6225154.1 cytoskeletal protein CcmA (bactofilin family) [Desmospora profundinema]
MEEDRVQDLVIHGAGSAAGGDYRDVKIKGAGKVAGGVSCRLFTVRGSSEVDGDLHAHKVEVTGTSVVRGQLEANEVRLDGRIDIIGKLSGEGMKIRGEVRTHGDCEAEFLDLRGKFSIDGLLNGGIIHLTLYGRSKAREIGGGTIRVRRKASWIQAVLFKVGIDRHSAVLQVNTIEGDDLELAYTHAKVVRGNHVRLGPGCKVERVEYSELHLDQTSHVGEKVKR